MSGKVREERRGGGVRGSKSRGFTLLELLVVLVIAGLMMALVAPNMQRASERHALASQRHALMMQVNGLGYRAYSTGTAIELSTENVGRVLSLPPGWQLRVNKPINYSLSGVCAGGEAQLIAPEGSMYELVLLPPLCKMAEF